MVDNVSSENRREMMSHNRGKDTSTELTVRRILHNLGFRYRLHDKRLPGSPDLVMKKYGLCIFVNGCFWHQHSGCKKATIPTTNREFWKEKFRRNAERDMEAKMALEKQGWKVLVIWECQTKKEGTLLGILSTALPINRSV